MQTIKPSSRFWFFLSLLFALMALAFGLSFGDSSSNHPTYLPPGIKLAQPDYLPNDWWLNNATHYHLAFNLLISVLAKIDMLAWGTALINLLIVSLSLFFIFNLFRRINQSLALPGLLVFCSLYLLTNAFNSVATTYLFTSGLQASNIATLATLGAIIFFMRANYFYSGLCLSLAGIFHINFLLVNIVAFGLAFLLLEGKAATTSFRIPPLFVKRLVQLLAPSGIYLIICLPLIFEVSQSSGDENITKLASEAFFQFAVPHHYLPNSYLLDFLSLIGWQLLGLSFLLVVSGAQRLKSLNIALIIVIWIATALTTVVFIESIARMFFWRLAPFSMLLACIAIYSGINNLNQNKAQQNRVKLTIASIGAVLGSLLILRMQAYYYDLTDPRVLLFVLILFTILVFPLFHLSKSLAVFHRAKLSFRPQVLALSALLAVGSFYATFDAKKYSLVFLTQEESNKRQLYSFVNQHTSKDTNILIPPELGAFRLFAERSVVVDFKALPFRQEDLVEWYHRLSQISGIPQPKTFEEVSQGYKTLDDERLEELRQNYNISYAVLKVDQVKPFTGWGKVFENQDFVLLQAIETTDH